MNKYARLSDWLRNQSGRIVTASFDDIEDEDRIGVELPLTARERRSWWGNEANARSRHVQCQSWLSAGWKVEHVDFATEMVAFVRQPQ
jgi:hypothetical protein